MTTTTTTTTDQQVLAIDIALLLPDDIASKAK